MICQLCNERQANKKNTHYLTDSIIRTCLNEDGSNEREKGFYFDLSNDTPFVDFNFQRGTSVNKLEQSLGRQATDDEIKKAKEIPFSVDNIFCSQCEDKFTIIENAFVGTYLSEFREKDLTNVNQLEFDDFKTFRMFFYLQVWRTAICEKIFQLDADVQESLRLAILNFDTLSDEDVPTYPMHVTYLQTIGDEMAYTSNGVGCTNDRNPNIIIINDFIIQFFNSPEEIKSIEFYGLNDSQDLANFINSNNQNFIIKVLPNAKRLDILNTMGREEKVQKTKNFCTKIFVKEWYIIFGGFPYPFLIQEYLEFITAGGFNILQYTEETIKDKTTSFIESKIK